MGCAEYCRAIGMSFDVAVNVSLTFDVSFLAVIEFKEILRSFWRNLCELCRRVSFIEPFLISRVNFSPSFPVKLLCSSWFIVDDAAVSILTNCAQLLVIFCNDDKLDFHRKRNGERINLNTDMIWDMKITFFSLSLSLFLIFVDWSYLPFDDRLTSKLPYVCILSLSLGRARVSHLRFPRTKTPVKKYERKNMTDINTTDSVMLE